MEIQLSGSDCHQYSHYRSGNPLFQKEKDAVNGLTEELTVRLLPVIINRSAAMAELADAQDLGSCIERCVGSSPTGRMIKKTVFADKFLLKAVFLFTFCIPGNSSDFSWHTKTAETRITAEFPPLSKSEASGIRTPDNLIKSQVLYRLS